EASVKEGFGARAKAIQLAPVGGCAAAWKEKGRPPRQRTGLITLLTVEGGRATLADRPVPRLPRLGDPDRAPSGWRAATPRWKRWRSRCPFVLCTLRRALSATTGSATSSSSPRTAALRCSRSPGRNSTG